MSDIPGGPMANRPVHFIWLLDCSYSMQGEKIGQLNYAIREAVPEMRAVAQDNPAAQLLLRTMTFSTTARWHHQDPVPVEQFTWQDVQVDGMTNLGEALQLAARELDTPPMPQRALKPVLALVSDGVPTDDWKAGLRAVDATRGAARRSGWPSRSARTPTAPCCRSSWAIPSCSRWTRTAPSSWPRRSAGPRRRR
ncbi:VWA domain-containing protein [Streptomyces sp. MS1.HAVA.3]|uniref:VWA domain-containing protein n=1 Tax=Streptomyces caledonius TaxID=3134107 RepID=A0ABU8U1U5_9ACTN